MTALLDGERGFLTYKSSGHPVAPGSTCELTVDLPSPSVMVWSWEEAWGRDILFKVELPGVAVAAGGHASQCHPQLSRLSLSCPQPSTHRHRLPRELPGDVPNGGCFNADGALTGAHASRVTRLPAGRVRLAWSNPSRGGREIKYKCASGSSDELDAMAASDVVAAAAARTVAAAIAAAVKAAAAAEAAGEAAARTVQAEGVLPSPPCPSEMELSAVEEERDVGEEAAVLEKADC